MESVQNRVFESEVVILDGRAFIRCQFTDCELRYSGGEFSMVDTLLSECRWAFGDAARRTMEVLSRFNVLADEEEDFEPEGAPLALPQAVN